MSVSLPIEEWRNLYRAAVDFKKIECWNWMLDSDVFGVQNPANGEIGYCAVMGRLGEVFGTVVYLGTEGLEDYLKTQAGEVGPGDIDAMTRLKCLQATFEDRRALQKPDLEIIRKLGLKFRGRNEWPIFRSYLPGYCPWHLTREEARYLTLVLEQATEVALRFEEDPELLTPPKPNLYFVRVPEETEKGLRWKDAWLEPAPPKQEEIESIPVDEVRLRRIRKAARSQQGVWEVDYFYMPSGVAEGERPYYPCVTMCVDHRSGMILGSDLSKPSEHPAGFIEHLLNLFERRAGLPKEIWVRRAEAFELLEPFASGLGIKLKLRRRLRHLEEAQRSMVHFLGMGR